MMGATSHSSLNLARNAHGDPMATFPTGQELGSILFMVDGNSQVAGGGGYSQCLTVSASQHGVNDATLCGIIAVPW